MRTRGVRDGSLHFLNHPKMRGGEYKADLPGFFRHEGEECDERDHDTGKVTRGPAKFLQQLRPQDADPQERTFLGREKDPHGASFPESYCNRHCRRERSSATHRHALRGKKANGQPHRR